MKLQVGIFLAFFCTCAIYSRAEEEFESFRIPDLEISPLYVNYEIGPVWDRITPKEYISTHVVSENFKKLLKATAKVTIQDSSGAREAASAIYLGFHNGQHLMATNYHVLSSTLVCRNVEKVYFEYLNLKLDCKKVLISIPEIDFTLFSITEPTKKNALEKIALQLDFTNEYGVGTPLYTAGFGNYKNSPQKLTMDPSTTCQLMRDTANPILIKSKRNQNGILSLPHACEISPGDSGSTIISQKTGKIIGFNYLVTINRSPRVREPNILEEWKKAPNDEMLSSLSYAISLKTIYQRLKSFTEASSQEEKTLSSQEAIKSLLGV